ncbi:MAG: hypothetical protein IMHGJWDQ_001638 [Candidatus Fervidibacter sp.]
MRRALIGFLIAQVLAGAAVGRAENPVGVITEVKGQAQIRRAHRKAWQPVQVNMLVYPGDTLRTGNNARVVVWTPVGRAMAIGACKSVSFKPVGEGRPSLWREVWGSFVKRMRANFSEDSLTTVAAARSLPASLDNKRLTLLSPRNTRILEVRPIFVWSEVEGAKGYRITIGFFDEGRRVWETIVSHPPFRYPDEAPDLKPGKVYVWQVEAIEVVDAVESAWFVVVPPAEARDIRFTLQQLRQRTPDLLVYSLMAASFLEEKSCYADAIKVLKGALERFPQQPEPRFLLATLYETIGLESIAQKLRVEAREGLSRARTLGWHTAASR